MDLVRTGSGAVDVYELEPMSRDSSSCPSGEESRHAARDEEDEDEGIVCSERSDGPEEASLSNGTEDGTSLSFGTGDGASLSNGTGDEEKKDEREEEDRGETENFMDSSESWSPPPPRFNPTLRLSSLIQIAEAHERRRPRRASEGDEKRDPSDDSDSDSESTPFSRGIPRGSLPSVYCRLPHRDSSPLRSPPPRPLKTFDLFSTLSSGSLHSKRCSRAASPSSSSSIKLPRNVCCDGVSQKLSRTSVTKMPLKSSLKRPSVTTPPVLEDLATAPPLLSPSAEDNSFSPSSSSTVEKKVAFTERDAMTRTPSPDPSADASTATASGATCSHTGTAAPLTAKKTVIVKLDPNTMRATTDSGQKLTMTLIDAAKIARPPAGPGAATNGSAGRSAGNSVRYSGITRVMVYSPEQCSAHVGHVCSKHKTVTIPLDSIEAMRRAEIMWPMMRYCYAVLTAAICLAVAGLLLFFLFPRAIDVQIPERRLYPATLQNPPNNVSAEATIRLHYRTAFRVINNNYIPITVEEFTFSFLKEDYPHGRGKNSTKLEIPLRGEINLSADILVFMYGFMAPHCQDPHRLTHTIHFKIQGTIRFKTFLGREGQQKFDKEEYEVSCGNKETEVDGGYMIDKEKWRILMENRQAGKPQRVEGEREGDAQFQREKDIINITDAEAEKGRPNDGEGVEPIRAQVEDGRGEMPRTEGRGGLEATRETVAERRVGERGEPYPSGNVMEGGAEWGEGAGRGGA